MGVVCVFASGDAVNWTCPVTGRVVYGFLEEDCPRGTPRLKGVMVCDTDKMGWKVQLERLRPTT